MFNIKIINKQYKKVKFLDRNFYIQDSSFLFLKPFDSDALCITENKDKQLADNAFQPESETVIAEVNPDLDSFITSLASVNAFNECSKIKEICEDYSSLAEFLIDLYINKNGMFSDSLNVWAMFSNSIKIGSKFRTNKLRPCNSEQIHVYKVTKKNRYDQYRIESETDDRFGFPGEWLPAYRLKDFVNNEKISMGYHRYLEGPKSFASYLIDQHNLINKAQ